MRLHHIFLLALGMAGFTSCAGYHFGGHKPAHLTHVNTLNIPLAKSRVVGPRIEPLTTNTTVDALVRDGTYRLANADKADAILLLTLEETTYSQARSSAIDVLRSEELRLDVTIAYQLLDNKRPGHVLESGKGKGHTRFFVDDNLQTARQNALPDALRRAAQSITDRLADGI